MSTQVDERQPQQQYPPLYTDVDAYDEQDAGLTEAAIAAAILMALAHPSDPGQMTADQAESIIEATVGNTLRFYAHRTIGLFDKLWRGDRPVDPQALSTATDSVDAGVRKAIDDTGESVREIVRAAAARVAETPVPTLDGPITIEQGRNDAEAQAYARLQDGLQAISRLLTTRTREEVKYEYAKRMTAIGKVWRTKQDDRVRTSHGDLEGAFEPIDEQFTTIKGARLQRPGDPTAPLYETINCRCRLSYRMPVSQ